MTGGVLVIIPRFTTLGSLVLVGAISNVFVLNMSYDVPVKQYSFHLLLMCLFVVAPDLQWKTSFAFDQPAPDRIMLDGEFEGRRVQAELHRETPKFLLTSRGFHWINEFWVFS
jgi:hypothetical protein